MSSLRVKLIRGLLITRLTNRTNLILTVGGDYVGKRYGMEYNARLSFFFSRLLPLKSLTCIAARVA